MGLYVKHEYDMFIKQVSHVNPSMTWTRLALTNDLFTNGLVVSDSQVMSNLAIASLP